MQSAGFIMVYTQWPNHVRFRVAVTRLTIGINCKFCNYFAPGSGTEYCNQRVCVSICLMHASYVFMSVCLLAYSKICTNISKFSVHVTCSHGSVFFSQQCNMLCTSGFVDDVMFLENGA